MRYVCSICGYVYDEARNQPRETLPNNWKCPPLRRGQGGLFGSKAHSDAHAPVVAHPIYAGGRGHTEGYWRLGVYH